MAGYRERKRSIALSFSLQKKGRGVLLGKEGVNCDCRGGRLKSGVGSAPVLTASGSTQTCPIENVISIVARKDLISSDRTYTERFGVLNAAGEFYTQEHAEGAYYPVFTGLPNASVTQLAGTDSRFSLALIAGTKCVYIRQDDSFEIVMLDHASGVGCFYAHRMFLGEKPSTLLCSAPENIMDFAESIHDGGLIRFPNAGGMLVGMKGYKDRLYLFFEYGILRLSASGAVKEFAAETCGYAGGRIYGRTLCVGERGVYFLAEDGVYRLGGERASRVLEGFTLPPTEETLLERSAAYAGRICMRYSTARGYRTLVLYEDDESGYYMDGLPIFTSDDRGRCLFTDEHNVIRQFSERGADGPSGRFISEENDLGVAGRKVLTGLRFAGAGSFSLTVRTGGRTLRREVVFADGGAEVRASEGGERFTFEFELPYGTEIAAMTATYTTVTGG